MSDPIWFLEINAIKAALNTAQRAASAEDLWELFTALKTATEAAYRLAAAVKADEVP